MGIIKLENFIVSNKIKLTSKKVMRYMAPQHGIDTTIQVDISNHVLLLIDICVWRRV